MNLNKGCIEILFPYNDLGAVNKMNLNKGCIEMWRKDETIVTVKG